MPQPTPLFIEQVDHDLAALVEISSRPSLTADPKNFPLQKWLAGSSSECLRLSSLEKCGLWLLAGDLDASHDISQTVETSDASFWHAIMHRREGDFSNAKYWFRRVGQHPVLMQLGDTDYQDAFSFVDRCETAIQTGGDEIDKCESLQWLEWQLLYLHCVQTR